MPAVLPFGSPVMVRIPSRTPTASTVTTTPKAAHSRPTVPPPSRAACTPTQRGGAGAATAGAAPATSAIASSPLTVVNRRVVHVGSLIALPSRRRLRATRTLGGSGYSGRTSNSLGDERRPEPVDLTEPVR